MIHFVDFTKHAYMIFPRRGRKNKITDAEAAFSDMLEILRLVTTDLFLIFRHNVVV